MKVFGASAAIAVTLMAQRAAAGYVTTSGTTFQLDGEDFYVFGTNAYWASMTQWSDTDLTTIFGTMADNDLTVCRVWGFNDATTASGIYFQLWSNGNATINTGADGLGYFDSVVAAAKAAGVKLVVPFVNNWSDYGGMDVYVQQLGGTYHDDFYTDETIKAAYKNFVKTFVSRYQDDETIMAWELCNECRCAGSGTLESSSSCDTSTITSWISEMSAYIKSIDSNHLVAVGDEGFMNTDSSVYLYSGPSGVDFDAHLAVSTIDYGTYHAYPDSWGVDSSTKESWGIQWIKDHVASGETAGKPVVMEEYGEKSLTSSIYTAWSDQVYSSKSHMQYWQFGIGSLSTTDDGYTIYDTDALFTSAIAPAAAKFKALSGGASTATSTSTSASATADSTDASASSTTGTTTSTTTTAPATTTAAPATTTASPATTTAAPAATTAAPATSTDDSTADEADDSTADEASDEEDEDSTAVSTSSSAADSTASSSTTDSTSTSTTTTTTTSAPTASTSNCSVRGRRN